MIEWVHGDNTKLAAIANEDRRYRTIDRMRRMNPLGEAPHWTDRIARVSVENRRRIKPAAAGGIEQPAAIVIRSIAPGLIAEPGVAA